MQHDCAVSMNLRDKGQGLVLQLTRGLRETCQTRATYVLRISERFVCVNPRATNQGLQMCRILRIIPSVEKRLNAQGSG